MKLSKILISGVRNISSAELAPSPALNLIIGENGSGKTSLLESIYILSTARSFRTVKIRNIVSSVEATVDKALIYGEITSGSSGVMEAQQGVEVSNKGKVRARRNGASVTNASILAHALPVQLINSDTFQLLEGSPKIRRQYMDWGLFHVEHDYVESWSRFNRALKQRNRLLRYGKLTGLEAQLKPWNEELAACAEQIHSLRMDHMSELAPKIESKFSQMCLVAGLDVSYRSGWDNEVTYGDYLANNFERDRVLGYTRDGPHRADLSIKLEGLQASERLSRGQSKMLVCALKLVQGDIVSDIRGYKTIYLVDDLPSELDAENRDVFLKQLKETKGQVFITAVDESFMIVDKDLSLTNAVFHVKQGVFSKVK